MVPSTKEHVRRMRALPYLTLQVRTAGTFSFRYGRIEVKAKLPKGDWYGLCDAQRRPSGFEESGLLLLPSPPVFFVVVELRELMLLCSVVAAPSATPFSRLLLLACVFRSFIFPLPLFRVSKFSQIKFTAFVLLMWHPRKLKTGCGRQFGSSPSRTPTANGPRPEKSTSWCVFVTVSAGKFECRIFPLR